MMQVRLPWKHTDVHGSRDMYYCTPKHEWIDRIANNGFRWVGGGFAVDKFHIEEPTWEFQRHDEVFYPIIIYGEDEEVALFKLKYF